MAIEERELTGNQALRIAKAKAVTAAQLEVASSLVLEQFPHLNDEQSAQLTGAVVQAMASNYLAETLHSKAVK